MVHRLNGFLANYPSMPPISHKYRLRTHRTTQGEEFPNLLTLTSSHGTLSTGCSRHPSCLSPRHSSPAAATPPSTPPPPATSSGVFPITSPPQTRCFLLIPVLGIEIQGDHHQSYISLWMPDEIEMEWSPPGLLPPRRLFFWQLEVAKCLLSEDMSVIGKGPYTVLNILNRHRQSPRYGGEFCVLK
nr:uncharacterized protein LOC127342995 isoform X2 [Lolium perenne]XP_051225025.1 uncharacterized protein LOC127342996 [Lolium perenne]